MGTKHWFKNLLQEEAFRGGLKLSMELWLVPEWGLTPLMAVLSFNTNFYCFNYIDTIPGQRRENFFFLFDEGVRGLFVRSPFPRRWGGRAGSALASRFDPAQKEARRGKSEPQNPCAGIVFQLIALFT